MIYIKKIEQISSVNVGTEQTPSYKPAVYVYLELDSTSDLADLDPTSQNYPFGSVLVVTGSEAHAIYENKMYMMQSVGTWVEQDEASRMDVYTRTETDTQISNAIGALDVNTVGGDGFYIESIRQADGLIIPTAQQLTNTVASGNTQPVTSRGVYSYVAPINEYLDYIKEFGVRNRMPQVKRVGTNNSNATPTFTNNGVTYTVNSDGSITVQSSSGRTSDSIVWLYDDFSAILADSLADGTYYFSTGFTGESSTARMRIKTGPSTSDLLVVSQYATIPESTYSGMNISIITYTSFTGELTIKPMFIKKFLYEADTAYTQYTPTPRECYDLIQQYHP